jgi:uncharacterized protein YdeI (YjbR/CyaY-like superfamily)
MNLTNPKVDAFLAKAKTWQQESVALRKIILDCGLTEEFKWWQPCYTSQNKNIVLIGGFKEYCALLFFQGALLKDSAGILVRIGEHTQAGRQIRFTSLREIKKMEPIVKAYIHEAILAHEAGLKVKLKEHSDYILCDELKNSLNKNAAFKKAFNALTPGRQRAYNFYFSAPKQSKTRTSRIEKYKQKILSGKGFLD